MEKKFLFVAATTLLCSTLLFSNGQGEGQGAGSAMLNTEGLPILSEPTEFEMMGILMNNTRQGRHDQTDMMKLLAEETNVNITWTLVPQDSWQEKKNLVVASGELPDAFHAQKSLSSDEIQKFGSDGVLIPLEDLIDQYAPNVENKLTPLYDAFTRSMDGHIYSLSAISDYGFDSFSSAIIKTEWLDALGLEMPTTTEEFYQVLKAFKTKDPNGNGEADEIPWSFLYKENPPSREVKREHYWIFPAFGVYDNPLHIAINDAGKVMFTVDTEEWKDAIQYLNRLYEEGLIDPEVFSQDRATLTNKVRNQMTVGLYTDYRYRYSIASPEVEDNFGILPPIEGPKGDKGWLRAMMGYSEGSFAITNSCQYPEALMRWVDYINTDENCVQMTFGQFKEPGYSEAEALIPSKLEPGKWVVNTDLRPETVKPSEWYFTSPLVTAVTMMTSDLFDQYVEEKASYVAKQETCDVYRPYLSKYPYNYPYKFSAEEVEELSLIQTDLLNFIYTTEAKWIVGGFSDSDWNTFKKELKKLQVDRYLEIYNMAYNRVN